MSSPLPGATGPLFGLGLGLLLCGFQTPASAQAPDTLTVVTLNLWHDSHDWPRRLNVIVAEMRRLRPDVRKRRVSSSARRNAVSRSMPVAQNILVVISEPKRSVVPDAS